MARLCGKDPRDYRFSHPNRGVLPAPGEGAPTGLFPMAEVTKSFFHYRMERAEALCAALREVGRQGCFPSHEGEEQDLPGKDPQGRWIVVYVPGGAAFLRGGATPENPAPRGGKPFTSRIRAFTSIFW